MYVRLNPPPPQQRYNYPVSVDRPIRLSATLLCSQGERLKQQSLLYFGIKCVLLSTVYIQASGCAKLSYVDNCDIGVNSNIFFIYLRI